MICKNCGAQIPLDEGFSPWCDKCNWNIEPYKDKKDKWDGTNFTNNLMHQLYGNIFFNILKRDKLKFTFISTAFLILLSIFVIIVNVLMILVFAIIGTYFLFKLEISLAVIFMLISFIMGCYFLVNYKVNTDYILDRNNFTNVYEVVDRIAEKMNVNKVDGIFVDLEYNASIFTVKGKTYLKLGLPLIKILDNDEIISLIGHELAHKRNNDIRNSKIVSYAMRLLFHWMCIIDSEAISDLWSGKPYYIVLVPFLTIIRVYGIIVYPINFILLSIINIFYWNDSQRSEYEADKLSSKITGCKSTIGLLNKLYLSRLYYITKYEYPNSTYSKWFQEFKNKVDSLSDREWQRIRKINIIKGRRIDSTHPPTHLREKYIALFNFKSNLNLWHEMQEFRKEINSIT